MPNLPSLLLVRRMRIQRILDRLNVSIRQVLKEYRVGALGHGVSFVVLARDHGYERHAGGWDAADEDV